MRVHVQRVTPILSTTVIISLRATQVEHKLPVFKMLLPPKLATTHPKLIEVLRENQHTLVHHWDVYETLRSLTFYPDTAPTDFGQFNSKDEATEHQPQVGLSLLEPIASSRTCTDAGIPDEVCVCGNEAEVSAAASLTVQIS